MAATRVLLINPWIHDFAAYDFWLRPMGLLYLATKLRQWGFEVDLVDCLDRWNPRLLQRQSRTGPRGKADGRGKFHKEEIDKPAILRDIPRRYSRYGLPPDIFLDELAKLRKPDAVLLTSSMTYWYPGVQETIAYARKVFPEAKVVLGGTYATLMPEHARANSGADYVVEGKNIRMVAEILGHLAGREISPVGDIRFPSEEDSPAYDLLGDISSVVIFSSWGCPFRCTYCASWRMSGEFRQRDASRVVDEIEFLWRERQTRHFVFFDDALLFEREKHFFPIVEGIIARKIKAAFHTPNAIHPRYVDRRAAALMREANFQTICLGLETTSSSTQRRTGAKVTNSEFIEAVACLEGAGFPRHKTEVYAMMGLPGQEADEVRETLQFIHGEGCTIRLASYCPIPGTEEWGRAIASSDLPLESDPLLHNGSIFPVRNKRISWGVYEDLKAMAQQFNSNLLKGSPRGTRR